MRIDQQECFQLTHENCYATPEFSPTEDSRRVVYTSLHSLYGLRRRMALLPEWNKICWRRGLSILFSTLSREWDSLYGCGYRGEIGMNFCWGYGTTWEESWEFDQTILNRVCYRPYEPTLDFSSPKTSLLNRVWPIPMRHRNQERETLFPVYEERREYSQTGISEVWVYAS